MAFSLIINADDFGITKGASVSIVECHQAGAVTSTTLMSNMQEAEFAASLAAENPGLGVGLHFNLTLGAPISISSSISSLAGKDGKFMSRTELLKRCAFGLIKPEHLLHELNAQWLRCLELGVQPTHIDSHQHVHAMPAIFRVVAEFAAIKGVPIRIPWRWTGSRQGKRPARLIREWMLNRMFTHALSQRPRELRMNDGFCSIFDLPIHIDELRHEDYLELLVPYRTGVIEMMVHPAIVDQQLQEMTAITTLSQIENRLLRSDFLAQYMRKVGGRLANYTVLA